MSGGRLEKMESKKICGTCAYFRRQDGPKSGFGYGDCHRNAPVMAEREVDGQKYRKREWPQVNANDWCGEYKPCENGGPKMKCSVIDAECEHYGGENAHGMRRCDRGTYPVFFRDWVQCPYGVEKPVAYCETCKYLSLSSEEEPCNSCEPWDRNWEPAK
jgi:hypothetical protein